MASAPEWAHCFAHHGLDRPPVRQHAVVATRATTVVAAAICCQPDHHSGHTTAGQITTVATMLPAGGACYCSEGGAEGWGACVLQGR
jgi:hypothetical protein